MPDLIGGDDYVRNLASFVRTNERQLANPRRPGTQDAIASVFSSSLHALNIPVSSRSKSARLALTPHHLYYLLTRFHDLGLSVGPLSIPVDPPREHSYHTNGNDFLDDDDYDDVGARARRDYNAYLAAPYASSRLLPADRKSLQSVTSMRSTMSGMSAIFSRFSFADHDKARQDLEADIKYLYSAFSVIPAIRLAPDRKAKLIQGFEDYPSSCAVPVTVFKNLTSLELGDLDVRLCFGWSTLSERLRMLSIKRCALDDPVEVLVDLVLDDMDHRRKSKSAAIPSYCTSVASDCEDSPVDLTLPKVTVTGTTRPQAGSASSVASSASSSSGEEDGKMRALGELNWTGLRHLALQDCGISCVSNESMAPLADSLVSLDMSCNSLISIPEALSNLTSLVSLNISFNVISSLHSLAHHPLPAITVLNLRGNNLVSLAGLDRLVSIERLDLRENKLSDPMELARLTGAPNISEVWVLGNPFVKTHGSSYRVNIFNLFRNMPGYIEDILLDGTQPGVLEQRQLQERAQELVPTPLASRQNTSYFDDAAPIRKDLQSGPVPPLEPQNTDIFPSFKGFNFFKRSPSPSPAPSKPSFASEERSKNNNVKVVSATVPAVTLPRPASTELPAPIAVRVTAHARPVARKRPGRRRMVELDTGGGGDNSSDDQASALSQATSSSNVSGNTKSPASPPLRPASAPVSAVSGIHQQMPLPPLLPAENEWTKQGEEYRKRVEALRNDFGSGWLSVLSEEM
ncbi:uncharacterized protein V1518DRAFT_421060 [Limtongia smithiae]|uniref:uncharacterized protein n=1 Tax=Limtongia smithiae TaxID=1125753 RepID=UPI0034CE77D9